MNYKWYFVRDYILFGTLSLSRFCKASKSLKLHHVYIYVYVYLSHFCLSLNGLRWRRKKFFNFPAVFCLGEKWRTDFRRRIGWRGSMDILATERMKLALKYRVFIKYCVFPRFWNIFRTLAALGFPSVSVCVHNGRSKTSNVAELAEIRKITTF